MSVQSKIAFFDLLEDQNAAALMSQIYYWYLPDKNGVSKLRIPKRGHYWIIKNHTQWYEETRLTRRQVDRAIGILTTKGFIAVEVHRHQNTPTRHIRCPILEDFPLNTRVGLDISKAFSAAVPVPKKEKKASISPTIDHQNTDPQVQLIAPPIAPECAFPIAPAGALPLHTTVQPLTKNTQETTQETTLQIASDSPLENWIEIKGECKGIPEYQYPPTPLFVLTDLGEPMNADEVLASFKSEGLKVKTGSTGVKAMALTWRKALALEQGGYVQPLTGKEVGQLQHVHKVLGESALAVLHHALADWQSFALEASIQAGVSPPMSPHTGFFCQHYGVAVNLMNKKDKPVVKLQKNPEIVQSIAAKCASAQTDLCDNKYHDPKATTDDVKATLAALAAIVAAKGIT